MNTIEVTLGTLGQVKLEEYYPYVLAAYEKLGNVHTSLIVKEMIEHMQPVLATWVIRSENRSIEINYPANS